MMKFNVSVVIPVYNAEKFLEEAVNSALQFNCVKEVLLIEDASPDNALAVCYSLAKEDTRVKVFTHPNNENKGAGASRNLGVEKSTSEFIAFLDADDWCLPNRFDAEKQLFKDNEVDGVYGATGFYYENSNTLDEHKLTTISSKVLQENLLYEFVKPGGGRFTTDAITFRKSFLKKVGLYESSLKLHQDTELFIRCIHNGILKPGICNEPIAYRRVHENNRILNPNKKNTLLFYNITLDKLFKQPVKVDKRVLRVLVKSYIIESSFSNKFTSRVIATLKLFFKKPNWILKLL